VPASEQVRVPAQGWAALHHGLDPGDVRLLPGWLRLMWAVGRPLARLRVPPTALTALGVVLAVDALLFARRRPWAALALVLAAVLCDGLDGAVAVLSDRASAAGAVADKLADRICDCAFAGVLWQCGAPWWLALAAAALSLVHEGVRELLGGRRRTRITVAERPTRTVCALLACLCAGVSAASWPPTVCAAVWVAAAVVGLAQLRAG
jgi:phosphatidylglycerophosphate synthase